MAKPEFKQPSPISKSNKLNQMLEENKYDPLLEAIKLLKTGTFISNTDKIKFNLELCKYIYPQLKSIEVDAKLKSDIQITIMKFGHLLEENQKAIEVQSQKLEEKVIEEIVKEEENDV